MKDSKKNGFFSWLSSKIKKKKTIDIRQNNTDKNHDINHEDLYTKKDLLIKQDNPKKDEIDTLNDHSKDIEKAQNTKNNFFLRLKKSLKTTKKNLGDKIYQIFLSKKIDEVLFEELEEKMLLADIGINTTNRIISNLIKDVNREDLKNSEKLYFLLKRKMFNILKKVEIPLEISSHSPFVILVVGVNGTGKTTTVAKLAEKYKLEGKSIMLAAADTFRAAGIEQLQTLGKLNNIPVIAQRSGSDPAAVIFDAVKSAKSKKIDVLIIDTAGRLHNKLHLIEELKKIVRVIKKIDISAPHEKLLIIDSCNGQNTIQQTEIFHKALNLTGIIITKLDGTAKGGVVFSLADQFQIPIRYIGIGEKMQDLGHFNSQEFIESIFT
ncbi:signal recognition particle-docking protein FtsY [Buchnera aphidicola]|uniref:Signal recognition particle receptor FtsY n=1 Tax=Buchnera aphidicola subsp. Acyrthosiphon pisum (strain 5A) TaxID=563178 RepID=A0A7U3YA48_BUCA5|nr:signal recognition particle-docking protein FtsY [Buchnera aphidicola]ACL29856.1 cell division protein FtsY [Buchnera aphidicola str. Tuc7 (Acyrthosiphon pisum)]ACL30409.1 cell division protein FtsY [Buchnera aphidicola str. 5A (Acyrthosiphon pisum)]OQX99286.1 MAG: signal recognition particle-docking protein FtsY [Erwiniaceae bacterium 4572_131]